MSGVKGRSGRKSKSQNRMNTSKILAETSPAAAGYLRDVANGEVKPSPGRVDVCKYIINQDLGMPRQKNELTGPNGERLQIVVKWDGNRYDATQQSQG